ncbi:hypothetical protein ER45_028145 (plasmid) [Bacillus mycoides]|nr:hypothetical protein ER45_028145 [Bacillus mycoides]
MYVVYNWISWSLSPSPAGMVLWIICIGLGQGASISLSYTFLGLCTRNT